MTLADNFKNLQKERITVTETDEQWYQRCLKAIYDEIVGRITDYVERDLSKRRGIMEGVVPVQPTVKNEIPMPEGRKSKYLKVYDGRSYFVPSYLEVSDRIVEVNNGVFKFKKNIKKFDEVTISVTETGARVMNDLTRLFAKQGIQVSFRYDLWGYCYESFLITEGEISVNSPATYTTSEDRSDLGRMHANLNMHFKIM